MDTPIYKDPSFAPERRADDLLGRMTLAEKVGQMMQLNGQLGGPRLVREYQPGSILHILNDALAETMDAAAQTRLGIPLLVGEDGIHGHSFHPGATIFPTQLALACAWDADLAREVARVTAREMAPTGAHWTFSPVLCVARDLRWGRVDETFGEDLHVIGTLAAAMIEGYQGKGLDDAEGVLACAKHYAGYSETQGGRDASEADLSRRKLRAFFLPPFRRAVEAGVMTFMTGYQSIDGLPSTANRWLLTEVLKEEWGFEGLLVTDWDNVGRLVKEQKIAPGPREAAAIAVRCGNDLIMTTPEFFEGAQAAVRDGLLREAEIDAAARRVLILKLRMGLFENARRPDAARKAAVIACPEHRAVNLRAARESLVLLQNDGLLPLAPDRVRSLAVLGSNADDPLAQLGDWSLGGMQYPPEAGTHPRACTETVLDGVRARFAQAEVVYARGADPTVPDASGIAEAVEAARRAEVVLLVVGDHLPFIGETQSTATLELQGAQPALVEAVMALGKPTVLVLVNSKPLVLPAAALRASAIVECFNPGMRGGAALAELLAGDLNPSGKLTISFAKHVGQQPIFYSQVRGQHGERYADLEDQEPLFAFGHGLSYTRYAYSGLRLAAATLKSGQPVEAEVEVANVGDRDGVEIVQAYVSDEVTSCTWVDRRLVAFERVPLAAGERRTVRLVIPHAQLALVNAHGREVVEPGGFELQVGPSSRPSVLLRASFRVEGEAFSLASIPGVAEG
jgi:beta-glucosidase